MFSQPEITAQLVHDRAQQWRAEAAPRHLLRAAREGAPRPRLAIQWPLPRLLRFAVLPR